MFSRRLSLPHRLMALVAPLVAIVAPAAAGELAFDILRNDKPIGSHIVRFDRDGGETVVRVETDIVYRLVAIPVYAFTHRSREVWRDGRLMLLWSQTDDNGQRRELLVERRRGGLAVVDGAEAARALPEALPASLWHAATVDGGRLLDTLDGSIIAVDVEAIGGGAVEVGGGRLPARGYRLRGDLERELWYDDDDRLVDVRFTARDGSVIRYRLRR